MPECYFVTLLPSSLAGISWVRYRDGAASRCGRHVGSTSMQWLLRIAERRLPGKTFASVPDRQRTCPQTGRRFQGPGDAGWFTTSSESVGSSRWPEPVFSPSPRAVSLSTRHVACPQQPTSTPPTPNRGRHGPACFRKWGAHPDTCSWQASPASLCWRVIANACASLLDSPSTTTSMAHVPRSSFQIDQPDQKELLKRSTNLRKMDSIMYSMTTETLRTVVSSATEAQSRN